SIIYPGTVLRGKTMIGEDCVIGPQAELSDAVIGNRATIHRSVLTDATVGDDTQIGPYAYLRPGSKVGANAKIGDFVELKNAVIGDGSKVPHLSYVGDA